MAGALARFARIEPNETGIQMVLHVMFTGPDTEVIAAEGEVVVRLNGTEQPAALRTAMSTAIQNWPASQGLTWTVPAGNIVMPTFQKG